MTRRIVLAVISDTHAGSRFALMDPGVTLYQEDTHGNRTPYTPEATATQLHLWKLYTAQMQCVFDLADGDELHLIHNGDETQGIKYLTGLVSTRLADQVFIAVANLLPWYKYPQLKSVRLASGTEAHNFLEGSSCLLVAEQLKARHPDIDTAVTTHSAASYNGCLVDYAHHGPFPGSRDWLRGNVARFYLRDLMYQEVGQGLKPPRLVLRAHYHTPVHEYLEMGDYKSDLYVTPSFSGLNEHATMATRSTARITWGMKVFEIVNGEITNRWKLYETMDLRTKETL